MKPIRLLAGKDMCRDIYSDGQGRRCVVGWLGYWGFGDQYTELRDAIGKEFERAKLHGYTVGSIAHMNDNPRNPLSKIAACINRALKRVIPKNRLLSAKQASRRGSATPARKAK